MNWGGMAPAVAAALAMAGAAPGQVSPNTAPVRERTSQYLSRNLLIRD